jgi:hypothetical protein
VIESVGEVRVSLGTYAIGKVNVVPSLQDVLVQKMHINELLIRYCRAVDERDGVGIASVFARSARISYDVLDREFQSGDDFAKFVVEGLSSVVVTQHMLGNVEILLSGDTARSLAYVNAQHVATDGTFTTIGGQYRDVIQLTEEGWRITERLFESFWNATGALNQGAVGSR